MARRRHVRRIGLHSSRRYCAAEERRVTRFGASRGSFLRRTGAHQRRRFGELRRGFGQHGGGMKREAKKSATGMKLGAAADGLCSVIADDSAAPASTFGVTCRL